MLSVLLLLPVCSILLCTMLLVLISDGMPVLFRQKRAGSNGIIFTMPKIRTLRRESNPNIPSYCYDIRDVVFPFGRVLRKYRLDELPQIFSILWGTMTFVGPRPELAHVVHNYTDKEMRRLYAKPGLTGLWQIRGSRAKPIHHSLKYDLYYLRKASLWLDVKILGETLLFVLKP